MTAKKLEFREAVERAKRVLLLVLSDHITDPAPSSKSGASRMKSLQIHGLEELRSDPAGLVERSAHNRDDFDALRYALGHQLHLQQLLPEHELGSIANIPKEAWKWMADFLLGKNKKPRGGRVAKEYFLRDASIALILDDLCKRGMTRYFNSDRKQEVPNESACNAVATALRELQLQPNSYERVADISEAMSKLQRPNGSYSPAKAVG